MSVLGELDHTRMLLAIIQGNPILSETTDCIQSTDYLHTKPDLLANLDSSDSQPSPRDSIVESSSHADSKAPEVRFSEGHSLQSPRENYFSNYHEIVLRPSFDRQRTAGAAKPRWRSQSSTIPATTSLLSSAIKAWLLPCIPRDGNSIHVTSQPAERRLSRQRSTAGRE
jgi:hypothetical protein